MSEITIDNKLNSEDVRSLSIEELTEYVISLGEKKFRAVQLFDWLHNKMEDDFDKMSNLSKSFIQTLKAGMPIRSVTVEDRLISQLDGTRKYLMRLNDGNIIECVLMRYEYGNSLCVSSQVGCRMGCRFCASTIDGLVRNLTAGEMLGQVYTVSRDIGEKIGHIVIMGSGEPLDNYDEVVRFLDLICCEKGQNLSGRNITLSTCGLVPRIIELADRQLQLTLAISLHATTDEKRKKIMPVANKYSIGEIIKACRYYFDKTGRRLTFEYSLIAGVNDTDEDAGELIEIAGKVGAHVNLIPVNPIKERDYASTNKERVTQFKNQLEKGRINATVRREMGRDIQGACGQLRRSYLKKE